MDTPGKIVTSNQKVILFDGVCNLCNSAVQFIIKRDNHNTFLFASLQSAFGQAQLQKFHLNTQHFHSIVLLDDGKALLKSDAALAITKDLSGWWPMLSGLKIFPRFLRDGVYDVISKNRYRFFGKKDSCMIPTPDLKSKFVS